MRGCDSKAQAHPMPKPFFRLASGSAAAKRPCLECSHLGLAKLAALQLLAPRRESLPTPQKRGASAHLSGYLAAEKNQRLFG